MRYEADLDLASSTTKKVCVRCFDGRIIAGYVSPQSFLRAEGAEILDRSAQVRLIPYQDIRAVLFVREFEDDPDAKQRKVFQARPKSDGLWIRMGFRDGEVLEGILPNNLLQVNERGVMVTPPDPNANTHKIFVPRAALDDLKVLGVIGSPVRKPPRKRVEPTRDQMPLFTKPVPAK